VLVASKSCIEFLVREHVLMTTVNRYEGAWVDDKRNGKGKLTLLGSEVYEGDFTENKKNGDGYVVGCPCKVISPVLNLL